MVSARLLSHPAGQFNPDWLAVCARWLRHTLSVPDLALVANARLRVLADIEPWPDAMLQLGWQMQL